MLTWRGDRQGLTASAVDGHRRCICFHLPDNNFASVPRSDADNSRFFWSCFFLWFNLLLPNLEFLLPADDEAKMPLRCSHPIDFNGYNFKIEIQHVLIIIASSSSSPTSWQQRRSYKPPLCGGCRSSSAVLLKDGAEPPHGFRMNIMEFLLSIGSFPTGSPSSRTNKPLRTDVAIVDNRDFIVRVVGKSRGGGSLLVLLCGVLGLNSSISSVETPLEHLVCTVFPASYSSSTIFSSCRIFFILMVLILSFCR
ncbi:hypothetical protein ABFS83_12G073100 [Erythranthe nasuta]